MLIAVMSLRNFICATTKDIQAAATEKTGETEPSLAKRGAAEASKSSAPGGKPEEMEEETPSLKKSAKKKGCTEGDWEGEKKRRRKEKAKKSERDARRHVEEESPERREEIEVGGRTEQPMALSLEAADMVG